MPSPSEIRQTVTNQIIAALENDLVPWRRPWRQAGPGRHSNISSGKPYAGTNPLTLELHARRLGFQSRRWASFRQWADVGCAVNKRPDHVEPGRWSAQIVFFKPVRNAEFDDESGDATPRNFMVLRSFNVFNLDQVQGDFADAVLKADEGDEPVRPNFEPAERLLDAIGPDVVHYGGDKAFYARPTPEGSWPDHTGGDYIQLPHRSQFNRIADFYLTAMHEGAHWSEVRLQWDHRAHGYAAGELVAEMSACMLAAELGVPDSGDLTNHAAYLKSWLDAMRADSSFIFRVSTQANKVVDYLLSLARRAVTV
jgi:antirestriction protein ArdC